MTLFLFNIFGCLGNVFELKEGNIYLAMLLETSFGDIIRQIKPDDVSFRIFRRFTISFHFHYLVVCIVAGSHTQIDLRYFDSV